MCRLKQRGGIVARMDRDGPFLMSSFVHTYVFTVNASVWNTLASKVEKTNDGAKYP